MRLPPPEEFPPFSYSDSVIPPQYHCGKCGAAGVKLWRDYNTFIEYQSLLSLLCGACACAEQTGRGKSYTVRQDETGRVAVTTTYDPDKEPTLYKYYGGLDVGGDQIGWRVPAVPTEDGNGFWGYSSVPERGVAWWNRLPLTQ